MNKEEWIKQYMAGLESNRRIKTGKYDGKPFPLKALREDAQMALNSNWATHGYWTARIHGQYLDISEIK